MKRLTIFLILLTGCGNSFLATVNSGLNPGNTPINPVITKEQCRITGISPPVDVAPNDTQGICLKIPFNVIEKAVALADDSFDKIDADVLLTSNCLGVESPKGLKFIAGASLRKDATGADYQTDFRVPLPSSIDIDDYISLPFQAPDIPSITVPENKALLVAKVSKFKGQRLLKLVNIAQLKSEGGRKYLETLTSLAQSKISTAMKVDGPGIYAIYMADNPIGLISGHVLSQNVGLAEAVVVSSGASLLSITDGQGAYTLANPTGQAALVGYNLATGDSGQVSLPIEEGGKINPKTGEPVETSAVEQPLDNLDTLNLVGVDIDVTPPVVADVVEENLDFEMGNLKFWDSEGNASVLPDLMQDLFPGTNESFYSFISTGQGSVGNSVSGVFREIRVPITAKKLHVEYNFVSQEYPAWVNTIYNDTFLIYVAGNTQLLHFETVNSNAGQWQDFYKPLGNVAESHAVVGDVFQKFGGETGSRTVSYDFSACAGEKVRLIFGVSDLGDTIYDSAALINRIWFE